MDYDTRMTDIAQADRERRNAREAAELDALIAQFYPAMEDDSYAHSRNLTGEPSEKNRVYRATEDCWTRGLKGRTVGVARTTDTTPTVRVTRNGHTTIESARSFGRSAKKRQRVSQTSRRITSADLAPIGNVE
jgi:hypothetical protein